MKRIFKEPLVHFLLLGALLFAAYGWLNRGASDAGRNAAPPVRITASEVTWLQETWARQWQRKPTPEELRGLVTEFLKEELLAREARAMGLDQDDIIVRRRLAQKMEFLVQDTSRLAEPTEDDLRRFFAANTERFRTPARLSFTHLYFSPDRRKDATADAEKTLAELADGKGQASEELGDRLLLDTEFHDADEQTVAGLFGKEFARAVFALQSGGWQGPIESGYGLHLVRVSEAKPATGREFAEVKAKVLERWREQRLGEDNEKYFAGLLAKYEVVVDDTLKPLVGPLDGPITPQAGGPGRQTLQEGAR